MNQVEIGSSRSIEEDEIPEFVDSDLRDMSPFYHLYLISKILGEAIPVKVIMAKCYADQVAGEVSFVDIMVSA